MNYVLWGLRDEGVPISEKPSAATRASKHYRSHERCSASWLQWHFVGDFMPEVTERYYWSRNRLASPGPLGAPKCLFVRYSVPSEELPSTCDIPFTRT
jgi:hypothetical protein